jgi:hypothetical protein
VFIERKFEDISFFEQKIYLLISEVFQSGNAIEERERTKENNQTQIFMNIMQEFSRVLTKFAYLEENINANTSYGSDVDFNNIYRQLESSYEQIEEVK